MPPDQLFLQAPKCESEKDTYVADFKIDIVKPGICELEDAVEEWCDNRYFQRQKEVLNLDFFF
jgi:hypothetical protein